MTSPHDVGQAVVHNPGDASLAAACSDILHEEWNAVSGYLANASPGWSDIAEAWDLKRHTQTGSWKELALPLIVARRSLACVSSSGPTAANELWRGWALSNRIVREHARTKGRSINLVGAHPVFAEEAGDLSHPDVDKKVSLIGSLPLDMNSQLDIALGLVELCSGRCRDVIEAGFSTLVVLQLPESSPAGACISFTSRGAPGAIFLTLTAPILLAESLVHEAVHNVLYAATRLSAVTQGGRTFLKSPLRRDPRPLEGVIHQALVLDYLCEFYGRLLEHSGVDLVGRNSSQITRRLAVCREDRATALSAIGTVKDDLGPLGEHLVREMSASKS
jgi:HEXXH motif-containing protein